MCVCCKPEKAGIPEGHPYVHSRILQVLGCSVANGMFVWVKQKLLKTLPRKFFQNFLNSDYEEGKVDTRAVADLGEGPREPAPPPLILSEKRRND